MMRGGRLYHGMAAAARVRVRVPAGRGKEGEREQSTAVRLLTSTGGPGSEEEAGEATATRRSWRQCFHCRHREEGADSGDPLSGIWSFLFFQNLQ